jgi:hypothetical protein
MEEQHKRTIKDQYGRIIKEEKEYDFSTPERGANKHVIRIIILLLFLTAVVIFMFPTSNDNNDSSTGTDDINSVNVDNDSERAPTNENEGVPPVVTSGAVADENLDN